MHAPPFAVAEWTSSSSAITRILSRILTLLYDVRVICTEPKFNPFDACRTRPPVLRVARKFKFEIRTGRSDAKCATKFGTPQLLFQPAIIFLSGLGASLAQYPETKGSCTRLCVGGKGVWWRARATTEKQQQYFTPRDVSGERGRGLLKESTAKCGNP